MVWEIPIQRQHFDPPFLKSLFLIQTPESWTYCIELSGYCCGVGEAMTRGWACKIFHLRKSEGHQLLKTQHVSWLHYHIMDYWCDCQWGNCHLCSLRDGFRPDCQTWKTVKGPSSLISRPLEEKKNTAMIWRGCFVHNFTAIQHTFICWTTPLCDRYIEISHGWLQTEAFLKFCLFAIYVHICLGARLDGNRPSLNAGTGWNISQFRQLRTWAKWILKFTSFISRFFI